MFRSRNLPLFQDQKFDIGLGLFTFGFITSVKPITVPKIVQCVIESPKLLLPCAKTRNFKK